MFWKARVTIYVYDSKTGCRERGISDRRVRILCAEGKVSGVTREGRSWMILADAGKPEDGRFKATESLLTAIEKEKRTGCQTPADCGELERLTEEFGKKSNAFIREYHQADSLSCAGG